MRTILIADYSIAATPDKINLMKHLRRIYPDARVSFLPIRKIPLWIQWTGDTDMPLWMKMCRKVLLFLKRLAYSVLPGISFIELKNFRKVFKDGGTCMVVIPYCERHPKSIEDFICSYLHDHAKQCELFFMNKQRELVPLDFSKPALAMVDYHVCWHCNLKCKGCGHFCNLYKTPKMSDLASYISDMERLSELFSTIRIIHLMGGEPLLNPELPLYITESRRIFPFSQIQVYTNGLLIPKASESLFETMRSNDATFYITCYPPTENIKDKIIEICEKESVSYEFSPKVSYFYRQKLRWQYFDAGKSYSKCAYSFCHSLNEGKLCVCTAPIAEEAAKELSPTFCRVSSCDTINIYSPEIKSGYDILDRFSLPIPFCRFCDKKGERFAWEGHYPHPIDWK